MKISEAKFKGKRVEKCDASKYKKNTLVTASSFASQHFLFLVTHPSSLGWLRNNILWSLDLTTSILLLEYTFFYTFLITLEYVLRIQIRYINICSYRFKSLYRNKQITDKIVHCATKCSYDSGK